MLTVVIDCMNLIKYSITNCFYCGAGLVWCICLAMASRTLAALPTIVEACRLGGVGLMYAPALGSQPS